MYHYFPSNTQSSATLAILIAWMGIAGCSRQPVSIASRVSPIVNSIIPQESQQLQNASALDGFTSSFDISTTSVFDPTAPDKKSSDFSLEALQSQAEGGDSDCQAELGRRYETGTGTDVDLKQAAEWYRRAAENQNVNAMLRLGVMYQAGRGVRIDLRQSAMWYRVAADKNQPLAMARLGKLYQNGIGVNRDLESAAKWLRKAAELGEPEALLEIALLFESGMVGAQDFEEASRLRSKAKELMEKAAAADNLRALRWLAEWALTPGTVDSGQPDLKKAQHWLLRASELGDTIAMVRLAELIAGDSADQTQQATAIAWCTKAADKLEPSALLLLADFHDRGFGVPQDVRRAFELRKQSAERGDIRGMRLCAEMLIEGWGTKAQLDEGLRWYQLAARLGDGPSMAQVGIYFKEGRGYEKNDAIAVALFTRGALQNDPESLFQLAACRESGSGVPQDLIGAAHGFQSSAGLGHREAMFRLAELLSRKDNGLPANATDAVSWYELAALKGHSGAAERLAQMYATGDRVEQSDELAAIWKARVEAPPVRVDAVARPPENRENETPWGTLTAPEGDGATTVQGDTLSLTLKVAWDRLKRRVDGTQIEPTREAENRNAPRILREVTGDCLAEVTLPRAFRWEGTVTDADTTMPPPGVAGLLLWQDEENFARLDRVATVQDDQIHYTCDLRIVKDGAQVFLATKALSSAAVGLRLERNGDLIRASITQNGGQTWTSFRSQAISMRPDAKVGIAAFNKSDRPLIAEFQEFKLVKKE